MQKENSLGVPNLVSRSRPATRLIIIPANPKVRLQLYPKPDSVAFEIPAQTPLRFEKLISSDCRLNGSDITFPDSTDS